MTSQHKCLLVIIEDSLTDIVEKGEVTPRYYNPSNLFETVHILLINDDRPPLSAVREMVGDAELHIHNLPAGRDLFMRTLGWRPALLSRWAEPAVGLAREIRPDVIRCHGNRLNAFAASEIKLRLGIPYVVSLHINPAEDVHARAVGWKDRLRSLAGQSIERHVLRQADLVLPVYEPIVPYLKRLGIRSYQVCYNVMHSAALRAKQSYELHSPVRVLSVGRQIAAKNPDNLIRAVAQLDNFHLTLVGDGTHHDHLRRVAREECKLGEDRVVFLPAVPNARLCEMLPEFDIFATHSEFWEISKSVLEPLLTGLPVVINRRLGKPVPELNEEICVLVENSLDAYRDALQMLCRDHDRREALGRRAFAHARQHWDPAVTERRYAEVYRDVIAGASSGRA